MVTPGPADDALSSGETALMPSGGLPPEPAQERLAAGAKAGEYVIEAHVGSGAMGDVYRAIQPVIGKRVAVKVIKRQLAGSAEALERFVREARAVNRVSHPNVVDVFAMGRLADGRLWLAMDYLDGESLGRRLRREGPLCPETLAEILRPVCEAVAAAHAQGVVHRDLKTDNIFLAGLPARVYVLDFGISKVLADVAAESGVPANLTSEGAWIGTPAYMAPEQWSADGACARSDVYALGVVAYEALTGRPPFMGSSLPAIMEQHCRAEPPPMSTPTGGIRVPEALEAVIRRALAKKSEARPDGPLAFLAEVEEALGLAGPGGRSAVKTARARRDGPGRGRLAQFGALGAGLLLVAAAVLLLALGRGGGGPRDPGVAGGATGLAGGVSVMLTSDPPRAEVFRGAEKVGTTPVKVHGRAGEEVGLRIVRPGYRTVMRTIRLAPDGIEEVALDPIRKFEGLWRLPDGSLRLLERDGERVAVFEVDEPGGARRLKDAFPFAASEGERVVFGGSDTLVDSRAPNEPSCRIDLRAEYRYDEASDLLERRRERIAYDLTPAGKCVAHGGPSWGEWQVGTRIATGSIPTEVESEAGVGVPQTTRKAPPANKKLDTKDPKAPPQVQKKAPQQQPAPAPTTKPSPEPEPDDLNRQSGKPTNEPTVPPQQANPDYQVNPPPEQPQQQKKIKK